MNREVSQEIMGDEATRREKHIEIDDALNNLENEVSRIRDFVTNLSEQLNTLGPVPDDISENVKPLTPGFLTVYSSIADRIHQSSKNISESRQQLKDMLL